jgi:hypothetical protein
MQKPTKSLRKAIVEGRVGYRDQSNQKEKLHYACETWMFTKRVIYEYRESK